MSAGAEPALFTYRVTPDKVPCRDGSTVVRFQVTVTNETGREVPCSQLGFTIPRELAADPDAIAPSTVDGTSWSSSAAGGGAFTAEPQPPVTSLKPGETLGFVFDHVEVPGPPGTGSITVWEVTDATRTHLLDVTKVEATVGITALGASPVQVVPGRSTRITWTATGADSATMSWGGRTEQVDPDGYIRPSPLVTTTYTLTATGATGSATQQITVTALRAQVISFRATPDTVALGESTTLRWHVLNATACTLEPGGVVVDPVSGALPVAPTAPTHYVLEAVGEGVDNDDARPFVVDLRQVRVASFSADVTDVPPGDPVRLRWATDSASAVAVEPGLTGLPRTGDAVVHPATSTTYRLVADGYLGPDHRSVTVRVAPPALTRVTVEAAGDGKAVVGWEAPVGDVTVDTGAGPHPAAAKGTVVVPLGPARRTVVVVASKGSWRSQVDLDLPPSLGRVTHVGLSGPDGVGAAQSTVVVDWSATPTRDYLPVGRTWSRTDSRILSGRDGGRTGLPTGPPVATGWLWTGGIETDWARPDQSLGWTVYGAASASPSGGWVPVLGASTPGRRRARSHDHRRARADPTP